MEITYKADNPQNWIENISKQLNVPVIDGKIEVSETLGKGFIQQLTFSSDLTIYFFEIVLSFKNVIQGFLVHFGCRCNMQFLN